MKYLLDTCTFLWLAQQPSLISTTAAAAIDDPTHELYLSDASTLEIVLKHSAGKLPLPGPPRDWLPRKLAFHQLQLLNLSPAIMFRSGELPRAHRDPFDRLLAAQGIESGMTILSPDEPLSALGASRIW